MVFTSRLTHSSTEGTPAMDVDHPFSFSSASFSPSSSTGSAPSTPAGTQTGEEIPIVSRSNIKEFKDSFSNENFDFRNSPNITFFVYVSNFTWPIKIQVSPSITHASTHACNNICCCCFRRCCELRLCSDCRQIGFKSDSFAYLIVRADCPHGSKRVVKWDLTLFRLDDIMN